MANESRLTVQAFQNGKPIGEYVARSTAKTEQEMADWMHANRHPEVEFKFLGSHGFIKPSAGNLGQAPFIVPDRQA